MLPNEYEENSITTEDVFEQLMQPTWTSCHPIHIDNEGNVIFLNIKRKCFFLNNTSVWDDFEAI